MNFESTEAKKSKYTNGPRYKAESFRAAMRAVLEEGLTQKEAALKFDVSRWVLKEYLSGRLYQTYTKGKVWKRGCGNKAKCLKDAMKAVREEGMDQKEAAAKFNVPHLTLSLCLNGQYIPEKVAIKKKTFVTLPQILALYYSIVIANSAFLMLYHWWLPIHSGEND